MPYHDYKCEGCGIVEERLVSLKDLDNDQLCIRCDKPMTRLLSVPYHQFKGGGWSSEYLERRWPQKAKRDYFTGHKTNWAEKG